MRQKRHSQTQRFDVFTILVLYVSLETKIVGSMALTYSLCMWLYLVILLYTCTKRGSKTFRFMWGFFLLKKLCFAEVIQASVG